MLKGFRNAAVILALVIAPAFFVPKYREFLMDCEQRILTAFHVFETNHPNHLFELAANRLKEATR